MGCNDCDCNDYDDGRECDKCKPTKDDRMIWLLENLESLARQLSNNLNNNTRLISAVLGDEFILNKILGIENDLKDMRIGWKQTIEEIAQERKLYKKERNFLMDDFAAFRKEIRSEQKKKRK